MTTLVQLCIRAVAKNNAQRVPWALPYDVEEAVIREEHRLQHSQTFKYVLLEIFNAVEPFTVRQTYDTWCQNHMRIVNVRQRPPFPPTDQIYSYEWEYWEDV